MTRRNGERGPDQKPRKRRAATLAAFDASPDRAVRPFGSDARTTGWCYRCGSSHLWSEPCQR